jgi:hypothetical protein
MLQPCDFVRPNAVFKRRMKPGKTRPEPGKLGKGGYGERVQAELRGFYSVDVDSDLASFRPGDPENFGLWVIAFVGPNDMGGEEMFDFFVCSSRWIAAHPPEKGLWLRETTSS